MYTFPKFEPGNCSISGSNCCFSGDRLGGLVFLIPWFVMIHTVKGFSVVNEAEVDTFLDFPCLLYDPVDAGKWPTPLL